MTPNPGSNLKTVGIFNDSFPPIMDGVSLTAQNYAYWLQKKNQPVCVIAPKSPDYVDNEPYPVFRYTSIPIIGRKPYRLGFPNIDISFKSEIEHIPFGLVHAHCPFTSGLLALHLAREHKIPFFGICLGMQCAVIEFGRNVLGLTGAHSTEFNKLTLFPVIDIMEMQKKIAGLGGTMRLGAYPCRLKPGSLVHQIYQEDLVHERHRHRFEFNNDYLDKYQKAGMNPVGLNEKDNLIEIIELSDHPWFIGVQFHPEYKSTVARPHPLFVSFVKAAKEYSNR